MQPHAWRHWGAAGLSAGLLELPFPLAGPLPPGRSAVAWFALVPLLWAVFRASEGPIRPLRRAFLPAYACGVLWYAGNCYWIYDTMLIHGGLSPVVSVLLLVGFSLVLGAYFGLFGLCVALIRRRLGTGWALAAAPFLWVALDLAAARIISVPWDQLGYSQVDNALMTQLAPWTGVYGISLVVMAANALLAGGLLLRETPRRIGSAIAGVLLVASVLPGLALQTPRSQTTATAVLVQPNLDVGAVNSWVGEQWNVHIKDFARLAGEECKDYIAGIPQTNAPKGEIVCPPYPTHPDLVAWPESPAPYFEDDPRFRVAMKAIAQTSNAPLVIGGVGMELSTVDNSWREFNSGIVFDSKGDRIGRYDKIHLVPYGEFIPYRDVFFFAKKLTRKVEDLSRGRDRTVFRIVDQHGVAHRYGIFICYEAVFADEVRQFARSGAEVLVNISDDGWYGDTSAPWQHLNMARMRAIENRRWILRDTNNGVTAAIDPYGRVRQSIPRHQVDALPAEFGFRDDVTFYTAHGDVFAWCCALMSIGVVGWSTRKPRQ